MKGENEQMKKLTTLLMVLLIAFMLSGCALLDIISPDPEPDPIPVLTMEANVDSVLVEGEPNQIAWSIENVGDLFIREYKITFNVLYPMETKDNVFFEVVGNYLEVGAKEEGLLDLVPYDKPETVSVSWELFE